MADRDDILTAAEATEGAALDHLREMAQVVHCDPDAPTTAEQEPLPDALTRNPPETKSPARWAYERLLLYIANFERRLDSEQEIALGFAGSDAGVLRIEGLGYFDPDILTFYGFDENGARTQLIQHVTQLSMMLRAVPKAGPDSIPARRIGFRLDERGRPPAAS